MDPNDYAIYQAALRGDREAFEDVIRLLSRTLFAVAYAILQNREESEDVVQETLLKGWNNRWKCRNPEKLPAWLAAIARHRATDLLRRRRTVPFDPEHEENHPPAETSLRPDHEIYAAELNRHVHSALSTLPESHRTALMLRYFENKDYRSIEQTMGLTNGALRGILGRALGSMRKQLEDIVPAID